MPTTLADLLNVLEEWEFEGVVWRLRPPNQVEQGLFSRWLERRDRENAARATELDDADQEKLLRFAGINASACVYEWGSDAYCTALLSPKGFAKMLFFVLRTENPDRPVTEDLAGRMVAHKVHELAVILQASREDDDGVKKNLLRSVGLPPDYLDSPSGSGPSSFASATPPTT